MIPFVEFAPDQPSLDSGASGHVLNVVPATQQSYGPLQALAPIGNALGARCQGAASFRGPDGTILNAAGDATKLYKWNGATWSDISRVGSPYGTAAEQGWSFTQFGKYAVATNGVDRPQIYDITLGGQFSDLAAAPLGGRFVATIRDFVMVGQKADGQSAVHWSALNDVTGWTPGIDQADEQHFPDGGRITGVVGGQYAIVFQETAIRRGTYVGPDLIFQFDAISTERGCPVPGSVASYQQLAFFLAADGFFLLAGGEAERPIGNQKVDGWFWGNVNQDFLYRISATIDPIRKLYVLAFPSTESTDGTPDTLLLYNWTIDRWSRASMDLTALCRMMSKLGYTMDSLDADYPSLDAMPLSLDSALLTGSPLSQPAAFDADNRMAFFEGPALAAEIDTVEAELTSHQRSFVRSVRPLINGGILSVKLGVRDRVDLPVNWGGATFQDVTGDCPQRSIGRYHRARVSVSAGGSWSHAQGVDVEVSAEGER